MDMLVCDKCGWKGASLVPNFRDNTSRCPRCNMVFQNIPAMHAQNFDIIQDIEIHPLRNLTYQEAKKEISEYIDAADHEVYLSELAEKLRIDIDAIILICCDEKFNIGG